MNESFDLQTYLSEGIEHFMAGVIRATMKNPKESAFVLRFAAATKAASRKRKAAEAEGEHIPSFLIASITSQCNLHCAGCYSRCNHATVDAAPVRQLTDEEWHAFFSLLVEGRVKDRTESLETDDEGTWYYLYWKGDNGTFIDARYYELFDRCRNLVPILSIEGGREITDERRGSGIYDLL
ncbi:MAG: radical SAM protein, partial [Oscillospiraceae bacterium]|nr:radical SAM protein [Oscillospiraceae bacterium]